MRSLFSKCALLLFTSATLAGCFEPTEPICAYSCGPGGDCPVSYHCQNDNYCHKNGTPEDAACEFSDAAVPDEAVATEGDLGPDGGPLTSDAGDLAKPNDADTD